MSHLSSFFSALALLADQMSFKLLAAVVAIAVIGSLGLRQDSIRRDGDKKP